MNSFSPKQKEVWRNTIKQRHRWNVSLGATRSGKTYLDYYKIPYRIRNAPKDGLILLLGNTKGTLDRNILSPMRTIWGGGLVGPIGSDNKVTLFGRECYALGADKVNQVSKLQGSGLAYCYGDEITTWSEPVFQMLKSRLDKPGACFDGTCNPDNPNHWFKSFLDSDADIYSMKFVIDDNPFLEPEFVQALKREYAGTVYYDRYILGLWALAQGRIYDMFDPQVHTADDENRPYTAWYISMDYGTQNPTAMLLWGKHEGVWYMVDEYYYSGRDNKRQKTDEQYYADLVKFAGDRYIKNVIVDPAAASMIACIQNHKQYRVEGAKNDVINGIRDTATALVTGKIRICKKCKHTLDEINGYVWDDKAAQRGEDKPLKENDHAMDAMRYFVETILSRQKAGTFNRYALGIG